jgi:hypothetical protein
MRLSANIVPPAARKSDAASLSDPQARRLRHLGAGPLGSQGGDERGHVGEPPELAQPPPVLLLQPLRSLANAGLLRLDRL